MLFRSVEYNGNTLDIRHLLENRFNGSVNLSQALFSTHLRTYSFVKDTARKAKEKPKNSKVI